MIPPYATRAHRRALEHENKRWPDHLVRMTGCDLTYSQGAHVRTEAWRSRKFILQVFDEGGGVERLSVNRTVIDGKEFADGITWDDLQRLKAECGRGHLAAVEVYPPDADVVNVASMRHLWVLPNPPAFMWSAVRREQ